MTATRWSQVRKVLRWIYNTTTDVVAVVGTLVGALDLITRFCG